MDDPRLIHADTLDRIFAEKASAAVMFSSDWSAPCAQMAEIFGIFSEFYGDELQCFVIDPDQDALSAVANNIQTIPTVLFIRDGKERARCIGVREINVLERMKEKYIDAAECAEGGSEK